MVLEQKHCLDCHNFFIHQNDQPIFCFINGKHCFFRTLVLSSMYVSQIVNFISARKVLFNPDSEYCPQQS